jgi:hypothetical protein
LLVVTWKVEAFFLSGAKTESWSFKPARKSGKECASYTGQSDTESVECPCQEGLFNCIGKYSVFVWLCAMEPVLLLIDGLIIPHCAGNVMQHNAVISG